MGASVRPQGQSAVQDAFCRRRWFQGLPIRGSNASDIGWFTPAGQEMSEEDWQAGFAKSRRVPQRPRDPTPDERGERITDESFYVLFNSHNEPIEFRLPEARWGTRWAIVLDTNEQNVHYMREDDMGRSFGAGEALTVQAWSLVLLRRMAWE